jgi:hypothetical protein
MDTSQSLPWSPRGTSFCIINLEYTDLDLFSMLIMPSKPSHLRAFRLSTAQFLLSRLCIGHGLVGQRAQNMHHSLLRFVRHVTRLTSTTIKRLIRRHTSCQCVSDLCFTFKTQLTYLQSLTHRRRWIISRATGQRIFKSKSQHVPNKS